MEVVAVQIQHEYLNWLMVETNPFLRAVCAMECKLNYRPMADRNNVNAPSLVVDTWE